MATPSIPLRSSTLIASQINNWTDDLPVCHLSGVGFATNTSYREDGFRQEDHEFEDRSIHIRGEDDLFLYGVFDGHNGSRVSVFASQRIPAELLFGQIRNEFSDEHIQMMLHQAFHGVEKGFYDSIDDSLAERAKLFMAIPENIQQHELQTQFPDIWKRNAELEQAISGGTTAVVALLTKDRLFIANTGCSRALLCVLDNTGVLRVTQLSVDHCIGNELEDNRLETCGVDIRLLARSGLLRDSNCTRSIGDHSLKTDFRSVDFLRSVSRSPVIAEPSVSQSVDITDTKGFLILMSNGLCKTLENATDTEHVNKDIALLVAEAFSEQSTLNSVSQAVVDKIVRKHHDTFMQNPEKKDLCSKRKDMTLLIRNFNYPLSHDTPITTPKAMSEFNPARETNKSLLETIQMLTLSDYSTNQSEDEQMLFMYNQSSNRKLELDANGKIKPYVNFEEFFNSINSLSEKEQKLFEERTTLKPYKEDMIAEEKSSDDDECSSTVSSSLTPEPLTCLSLETDNKSSDTL